MPTGTRHTIDDTVKGRPHVRLCHLILRESLAAGFSLLELTTPPGGTPAARVQLGGSWRPLMTFPPQVYGLLVEHFKQMAGVTREQPEAHGTILVRLAGRDASVTLSARRTAEGPDELLLHFPATAAGQAAT